MHNETRYFLPNFFHLSFLKVTSRLIPLIYTPFLIRAIGLEQFGTLEFAKTIAFYWSTLISYGFKYAGAKQIVLHHHDKDRIGQIMSSVYALQFMIIGLCLVSMGVLITWLSPISNEAIYLTIFFLVAIASSLFPTFVFQGIGQMKWLILLNLIFKSLFSGSILLFIHQPADAIFFPLLLALSDAIRLIAALLILYIYKNIRFKYPVWSIMVQQMKEGLHIFLSQLAVMFYANFATIFLKLFVSPTAVSTYIIGEKLTKTTTGMLEPAMQALYPISHRELATNLGTGLQYLWRFTKISLLILVVIGIFYWILADNFVCLLAGNKLTDAVQVLKIQAFLPAITLISNIVGLHLLIPLQKGNKYTCCILAAGLLSTGLHFILVPRFQTQGAAMAVLLSELFTSSLLSIMAYKTVSNRIIRINTKQEQTL